LFHHPELSGCAIHGEVDGLDIGRQHDQWFDLLCHKSQAAEASFVQMSTKTSDTGAEAVELDPHCQWHNQEFCSGRVSHLMYALLFLPFISVQWKIGMKHQQKS